MAAIVSALGLFKDDSHLTPLPTTHLPSGRKWRFGHIAPFSGRLVFERLACSDPTSKISIPRIRILANDAILPLPFCNDGTDEYCTLDAFADSQAYARHGGKQDWERCAWKSAEASQMDSLQHKLPAVFIVQGTA
jgi:hypothetical protein